MPLTHPFCAADRPTHACSLLVLSFTLGVLSVQLSAQLPAANPTAIPSSAPPASQPQSPKQPHRSQITFDHGLLTVTASNASLNGLIREIARQTGMRVSGAVAEDRVFGTYGPADPQKVLATLLDGTGSNILILSNQADSPVQLILTPRTGAATPPNPNANLAQDDTDDDISPPPGAPTAISSPRSRSPVVPGRVSAPPSANQNPNVAEPVTFPPESTAAPSTPSDTSTPTNSSADSVKTPQQIFEQLQKLRQQTAPGATSPQ